VAKILGVREQLGLPSRDVQGVGYYEAAGTVEREFSPYDLQAVGAFGAVEPYDLSAPGRVSEIKKALIALAQHRSDGLQTPAPNTQKEDLWRHIDTSPEFIDAWDGPTADAFLTAVSRYRHLLDPTMPKERRVPLAQLPKFKDVHGNDVIIGGPQPTVAGLEALTQAVHRILKDAVQLGSYNQWRGGSLDCEFLGPDCEPPDAFVTPTRRKGRDWNPRGWTVAWRNGPAAQQYPNMVPLLDAIDVQLGAQWAQAVDDQNENQREQRAQAIIDYRQQRNDIVKQLNKGAPLPECADANQVYDKTKGACVARCRPGQKWDPQQQACVIELPEVTDHPYNTFNECVADQVQWVGEERARADCGDLIYPSKYATVAIAGLAGAIAVGGYLLFRDKKIPDMPAPK
jgi:hypothetical protein